MEGAALQRRLSWRLARVTGLVDETARVRTLELAVPDWPGHQAGQHVDVRLTAEDGYRAERSYSISSAPDVPDQLALTVERIDDGEVSPYAPLNLAIASLPGGAARRYRYGVSAPIAVVAVPAGARPDRSAGSRGRPG